MAYRSNLDYFIGITSRGQFMLSADKGGGDGGGGATLKGQLEQANTKIAELEPKAKAHDDLKAEVDRLKGQLGDAEKARDEAKNQLTSVSKERDDAKAEITKLQGDVSKLKGEAKSADQRSREIAAANGTEGVMKDEKAAAAGSDKDGKALADQYQALMNAREFSKASAFYAKHEKALDDYMASADRRRSEED